MKGLFKLSLLCCFLLVGATAFAQNNNVKQPRAQFIGLFVNDLDSTLRWYTETIGFSVVEQMSPGGKLKFAMIKWNNFLIEMIQNPKVVSRQSIKTAYPGTVGDEGFFKMGFYVEDIIYWEKYFKEKQARFKYELMTNEKFRMKLFILEDPEGNLLQFFTYY